MESTTNQEQVIALTPNAVAAVKEIIEKKNLGQVGLRVGVQGGGCSGLSYNLNFETEATPHDTSFEVDGLRVIVDQKSAIYLAGTTLDFSKELVGGGFKFLNPNAKRSCGCGESFSA
ncbi:HesB/IscA family protein [Candidatus Manganitrophus noduliformans]|uniref:Iron-sulfur cluster assembly accessory protein n=1 Tax=Candidatus Manganitrophus noduliformans TaxID=2606439 RepID=A0A7X6DQI1_9BACT|nr:iron-sulfur cluster assembly accessory protein [Candidatus Manganitrophus noduliformans]NKE71462.1 iron-sulfur cluster assembly accessory protein [Candidatus Manganitrophus noduliformans]